MGHFCGGDGGSCGDNELCARRNGRMKREIVWIQAMRVYLCVLFCYTNHFFSPFYLFSSLSHIFLFHFILFVGSTRSAVGVGVEFRVYFVPISVATTLAFSILSCCVMLLTRKLKNIRCYQQQPYAQQDFAFPLIFLRCRFGLWIFFTYAYLVANVLFYVSFFLSSVLCFSFNSRWIRDMIAWNTARLHKTPNKKWMLWYGYPISFSLFFSVF